MNFIKSLLLTALFFITAHAQAYDVLVSVAPHKYFVEKIANNAITVGLMVPAGASSHTYEPTPRQMIEAGKANIWFQIGESFEDRAGRALQNHNPRLELVDLQKGLDLIYEHSCCQGHHHHAHSTDPHFWLSARQGKIQAKTITDTLVRAYPQHKKLFEDNLSKFLTELDELDVEISGILKPISGKTILVSHPAYAYFCRDYNLKQLSVEFEGKDPTPQQLTTLLQRARQERITKIFIQQQYSNKGAKLIAAQIGADVVTLDPYAEEYAKTMIEIAKAFSSS